MPAIKPRLAITMGDPAGVGPELCLRVLANTSLLEVCTPLIFGDASILERVAQAAGLPAARSTSCGQEHPPKCRHLDDAAVIDLQATDPAAVTPGQVSAATGRAAYRYIEAAIAAALAGEVDGVVTAPIHKEALSAVGIEHPGHTEIFAAATGARGIA